MVRASSHAALRFVERVRPGMDVALAGPELERLIAEFGRRVPEPVWLAGYSRVGADFYVEISDGIVVPCRQSRTVAFAVTVLVRSSCSPETRARRHRRRTFTSRGRKVAQRGREFGGERGPDAGEWAA